MNQNRKDRDVRNREDQIDDMTRERGSSMHNPSERGRASSNDMAGMGSSGERNRSGSDRSEDEATGISNRSLERERDEQHRVPDRGMRKSEE